MEATPEPTRAPVLNSRKAFNKTSSRCPASRAAARLSDQREDVLLKALHDFKTGARVGSGVASMADVTFELDDADMQALSRYMATRP